MTTAGDLIQDSYEMLGIYAPGQTISSADSARALSTLNDMLDSWSNESLTCFAIAQQTASLVAGTQSYTIGAGGAFNMTRPIRLIDGPGAAYVLDVNGNKYALDVVPLDKWNMIPNATQTTTSDYPTTLFYDPQFPLGIMNFYPYPTLSSTAVWTSYLQLVDFTGLTSLVSLPPGYKLAITTNLAVALKPYFSDAQLSPIVMARSMESKANVKRSNIRPNEAVYDPELVSRSSGTYNVYTDRNGYSGV